MAEQSGIEREKRIQSVLRKLTGRRLKKLGFYGFLFFFIKGMLWLIVPAVVLYFGLGSD